MISKFCPKRNFTAFKYHHPMMLLQLVFCLKDQVLTILEFYYYM